jgi:tetratricopeptide (TPR) repeat protein
MNDLRMRGKGRDFSIPRGIGGIVLIFFFLKAIPLVADPSCSPESSCTSLSPFEQFQRALWDEDLRRALKYFDLIERQYNPNDPLRLFAEAQLRFYEGDYARALSLTTQLLKKAKTPQVAEFSNLVQRTWEKTNQMKIYPDPLVKVYVLSGTDELLAPFVIETVRKAYEVFSRELGIELSPPDLPIRVEIYSRMEDFVAVSTLSQKEVETSGTIALTKFHRIMIISPRLLARGYRWRDTLAHELVHYLLLAKGGNPIPLWLHEGIAKYWERRWRDRAFGLTPVQETLLDQARRRGRWVPFQRMMPSLAKLRTGYETALAFSELAFWVHRFVERRGISAVREILDAFSRSDRDGYQALGGGIEELWQGFLEDIARAKLNPLPEYRFLPLLLGEEGEGEEGGSSLPELAKRSIRLGDLLKEEGRWISAISEYTQAERVIGGETIPLAMKKAEAYIIGGRYSLAQEVLERTLRRDPDRATTYYLLGRIALFRGRLEEALGYFEDAFSITPFHQGILESLVEVSHRLKDASRIALYEKALEVYRGTR